MGKEQMFITYDEAEAKYGEENLFGWPDLEEVARDGDSEVYLSKTIVDGTELWDVSSPWGVNCPGFLLNEASAREIFLREHKRISENLADHGNGWDKKED